MIRFVFTVTAMSFAGAALCLTFGPGPGEAYGTAVSTGHGGAASPYRFTSNVFPNISEPLILGSIDSITIHDLETSNPGGLQFFLQDGMNWVRILWSINVPIELDGDYTFVDDPSVLKITEVMAGMNPGDTLPSGTYRIEGGFIGFGEDGDETTWDHFNGTSINSGWNLELLNQSTENTGSFGGWTIEVTPAQAVPEPASMTALALGALAVLGRRRKAPLR
jgi:hypothetical protein